MRLLKCSTGICAVSFCCLIAVKGFAETVELDPIVVSAFRSASSIHQVAAAVTVYTQEDLKNLPARDLAEALEYMPGVSVSPSGPLGQAATVSMRGADVRQILVMVDGIPFNTQLSGQANLSRIPLENIERIEVIRGGDSSVWGSGLGGVINIVTKDTGQGQNAHAAFSSSFGQYALTKNSLEVSGGSRKAGFLTTGSFLHADGNKAQSFTREIKNFTKLSYELNELTKLNASFGYSGAELHYGPTNSNLIFDQPYISRYGQINVSMGQSDHSLELAYKYNDQDVHTDIYNVTTGIRSAVILGHDFYQGVSLINRNQINDEHLLTAGSDFDWHNIKSEPYLQKSQSIDMQAPFINDTWTINNWNIEPAARYDRNSRFGSQFSPSFGAVYHLQSWEGALIRGRAARAFNAPPLLWLYNNDPSLLVGPNPDLKAERANTYELGTEFKPLSFLTVSAEGYYSDVRDGIAVVFEDGAFRSKNFNKFRRQGGQATLDYQILPRWSAYTSGEFNDVINVQTKQIVRDAAIARDAFKWGTHYETLKGFGFNLLGYYSRSSAAPGQSNDRKPIFDIKLTQDLKNILHREGTKIFFNIHNLTNSSYWTNPVYPYPGRYVEGGFSTEF